jgi:hypothetical protein
VRRALAQLARLDPTRLDLALPRPWVCVLLVAAFLGFGALVGRVSSSPEPTLSASAHPQLRLILPQASEDATGQVSPPDVTSTPTPAAGSSEAATEAQSESGDEAGASNGGSSGAKGKATSPSAGGRKSGSGEGDGGKAGGGKGKGKGKGHGTGGGKEGSGGGEGSSGSGGLPLVKHVFVIMLSDQPYASVFGPSSSAPYLAKTLERRGELLVRYYAVAHDELANEIALVSGQGPTPQTEVNCPTYADVAPATPGADGQVLGQGCLYPASTETLAGQLSAKHLTWPTWKVRARHRAQPPANLKSAAAARIRRWNRLIRPSTRRCRPRRRRRGRRQIRRRRPMKRPRGRHMQRSATPSSTSTA